MSKYIDAEKLIAEIRRIVVDETPISKGSDYYHGAADTADKLLSFITSLQQELPEVDLEKLGEIARHLIAVKGNEEDMRLDEGEWLLLERIGYPERFNARK